MRYFQTLINLFMITTISYASQTNHIRSGVWYNHLSDKTIHCIIFTNEIKIRGLYNDRNWVYFDRISNSRFRNRYGEVIKFTISNQLVFQQSGRHSKLVFEPVKLQLMRSHERNGYNVNEIEGMDIRERYNSPSLPTNNEREQSNLAKNIHPDDVEGTWNVQGISKKVFIVSTRDGLKARFEDVVKWYSYYSKGQDYISDTGHTYHFGSNGTLIWTDKNKSKSYILNKVSDELEN